jgi:chemotaxis protein MotB
VLTREAEERLMGKGIPEITSTELLNEKRENPPPGR